MKKVSLLLFLFALLTSCSQDEGFLDDSSSIDENNIETRSLCDDDEIAAFNLPAIQSFITNLGSCPRGNCQNICVKRITTCFRQSYAPSDCISKSTLSHSIHSIVTNPAYCGKEGMGICRPTVSFDPHALNNNLFVICVTGDVWRCPDEEPGPVDDGNS